MNLSIRIYDNTKDVDDEALKLLQRPNYWSFKNVIRKLKKHTKKLFLIMLIAFIL